MARIHGANPLQIKLIAQHFVDKPSFSPLEVRANPRGQEPLAPEVPLGRKVGAMEDADFADCPYIGNAHCFVDQVFPARGGWVTR